MPTLYHFPIAICAQKNRVCLAEKGVAWESQDVTGKLRTPEYLKLNPGGYAPTLVHEGKVITESRVISEYIDENFEGPPLQPKDAYQRSVMRRWSKQIDDSLHGSVFLLTYVPLLRDQAAALPEAERQKNLPIDPTKRERALDMFNRGWESPYILMGLQRFDKLAKDLEAALSKSPWLAGNQYSLADADYTPYLQRLEDLGVEWLWEDKPAITDWYARVQARPSFSAVVKDWVSPEMRQGMRNKAKEIGPKFRAILENAKA